MEYNLPVSPAIELTVEMGCSIKHTFYNTLSLRQRHNVISEEIDSLEIKRSKCWTSCFRKNSMLGVHVPNLSKTSPVVPIMTVLCMSCKSAIPLQWLYRKACALNTSLFHNFLFLKKAKVKKIIL